MGAWLKLSNREKEFYYFIANGFRQVQIACLHFISEATVRTHLTNGMKKAKCTTIIEATLKFDRAGHIVTMPPKEKSDYFKKLEKLEKKYPTKKK
jgi:DNA-binding CsgD family transcriptional regulator